MIVMVQHKVRDYAAWKPVFDEHGVVRRQHGGTGHTLYREADDPNDLTVVMNFPSKEQAQAFAADPSLKEAMDRSGVVSEPHVAWLEELEEVHY